MDAAIRMFSLATKPKYPGAGGGNQVWYAYGQGPNDVLNQKNIIAGTRSAMVPDVQGSIIAILSGAVF